MATKTVFWCDRCVASLFLTFPIKAVVSAGSWLVRRY